MDIQTIEMPKAEARRQLQAVRKALHRKADAEYQALEAGYKELANGRPLLNVAAAIHACPLDEKQRPRLAIARADRRRVKVSRSWRDNYATVTFDCAYDQMRGRRPARSELTFPVPEPVRDGNRGSVGYALVPIVPPAIKGIHDLSRCHILWEVEAWADQRQDVGPDEDPLLLRHLHGELYVVLGQWDLTPLEQAVMAGRRLD